MRTIRFYVQCIFLVVEWGNCFNLDHFYNRYIYSLKKIIFIKHFIKPINYSQIVYNWLPEIGLIWLQTFF